ncbi:LOW QUALITY PROTEIN: hypothetical protein KUTeg_001239 [Tegillarca granosa]|uniref:Uncharacterized protein n=1 Tax=Tegillarca granosa TaxID=220873 RepID=A0ABQ9FWW6_TEGGR|nr:LOW QUALITY PROTEIN: hypothetical protein KUTeg_001239 [Tegillarca granosa]
MTTEGHIKQTIQKDKQHQSLYNDPLYVVENINEDVVVVDGCSPCAIVLTRVESTGIHIQDSSQSSHCESIASCYGIACDNVGCILVSDWGSHRIHQIDMDGKFIQFILTQQHGIQSPLGLSIDNKSQLWLCNNDGKEVNNLQVQIMNSD